MKQIKIRSIIATIFGVLSIIALFIAMYYLAVEELLLSFMFISLIFLFFTCYIFFDGGKKAVIDIYKGLYADFKQDVKSEIGDLIRVIKWFIRKYFKFLGFLDKIG